MELENGAGPEHGPENGPASGSESGPVIPLNVESAAAPAAERSTLRQMADTCFDSLLSRNRQSSDSAYCDVLVDELNRDLSRSAAEERLLVGAYHNRAVLNIRRGEFDMATSDLEEALLLQPELAELYLTRGNLYLAQNRFTEAIDDYTAAFELSASGLTAARRNRALAWRGLGNLDRAQFDWQAVRNVDLNTAADEAATSISPSGTAAPPGDEYQ